MRLGERRDEVDRLAQLVDRGRCVAASKPLRGRLEQDQRPPDPRVPFVQSLDFRLLRARFISRATPGERLGKADPRLNHLGVQQNSLAKFGDRVAAAIELQENRAKEVVTLRVAGKYRGRKAKFDLRAIEVSLLPKQQAERAARQRVLWIPRRAEIAPPRRRGPR